MKYILSIGGLTLITLTGWKIGSTISPDAVSMALGMCLAMMASIPTALLVLASRRQDDPPYYDKKYREIQQSNRELQEIAHQLTTENAELRDMMASAKQLPMQRYIVVEE